MSGDTTSLRVELSDGQTFTVPVTGPRMVLGRDPEDDLQVDEVGVSRGHAAVIIDGAALFAEDLGSTNGTWLNGQKLLARQALATGDELALGRAVVRVQAGSVRSGEPAAADSNPALATVALSDAEAHSIQAENRVLRLIHQLAHAWGRGEPESLHERIVSVAFKAFEPARVLLLNVGDDGELEISQAAGPAANDSCIPAVARKAASGSGRALLEVEPAGEREAQSVVCVPLKAPDGARATGMLCIEAPLSARNYTPGDLDLAVILANQAAALIENARLIDGLRREERRLTDENRELRLEVRERFSFPGLVGVSAPMQDVLRTLQMVVEGETTVLVTGDSGTGKEMVARIIHYSSSRRDEPFVPIHCAAIPDHLLEAELFGIERGVATGVDARSGKLESAGGGTIFLDEIGELPMAAQVKILRVLETREVERLGGRKSIPIRARLLAATNRDLTADVDSGRFRADLFYRLNVVPIRLPPLRDRPDDVEPLANHFLAKQPRAQEVGIRGLSPAALDCLRRYEWPGNVRELANEVARIVAVWDPAQSPEDGLVPDAWLAPSIREGRPGDASEPDALESFDLKRAVAEMTERTERRLIERALAQTAGNRSEAAALLGLSREGLRKKMLRYAID